MGKTLAEEALSDRKRGGRAKGGGCSEWEKGQRLAGGWRNLFAKTLFRRDEHALRSSSLRKSSQIVWGLPWERKNSKRRRREICPAKNPLCGRGGGVMQLFLQRPFLGGGFNLRKKKPKGLTLRFYKERHSNFSEL